MAKRVPISLSSGGIALLVLTILCWLGQLVYLSAVVGKVVLGDAVVGQAYAWIAAILLASFAWLWIGGLLLKAATENQMPGWANISAVVLYIGGAAAGMAAYYLMQDPKWVWPVIIPMLLPPILAFYVFALYNPSLRPFFSTTGSVAVWVTVLVLIISPYPSLLRKLAADQARHIENDRTTEEWKVQERARNRAYNLVRLEAMTDDHPVMDWYNLLDDESGVSAEAFERLRRIERRQHDIEDMLPWGILRAMTLLPQLDLKATPELCEAAKQFMLKSGKESRVREKQAPRAYVAGGTLEQSLPAIRWLIAHGCNCDEGIAAMEASVLSHLDSPDRKAALATIAELRTK